nr:MAG TPA: hypothetical protein [Bacteriophage sp.]
MCNRININNTPCTLTGRYIKRHKKSAYDTAIS